jgi:hypothetical protein
MHTHTHTRIHNHIMHICTDTQEQLQELTISLSLQCTLTFSINHSPPLQRDGEMIKIKVLDEEERVVDVNVLLQHEDVCARTLVAEALRRRMRTMSLMVQHLKCV